MGRGEFLLATLSLRIVDRPEGGMAALRMDAAGQRQPAYTRAEEPGVQYRFGLAESVLWIRVDQDELEESPAGTEEPLLAAGSTLTLQDGGFIVFRSEVFSTTLQRKATSPLTLADPCGHTLWTMCSRLNRLPMQPDKVFYRCVSVRSKVAVRRSIGRW